MPSTILLSGEYAFEVLRDGRVVSKSSRRHELKVPAGSTTFRLRSKDVYLNRTISRTVRPGARESIAAPALGKLAVYAAVETCAILIDGETAGYPPLAAVTVVEGAHTVAIRCPDGARDTKSISVKAGAQPTTVRFGPPKPAPSL